MTATIYSLFAVPLFAVSGIALSQTPAAYVADGLSITPQNGQSREQQATDRTACESWSKGQTGFDITQPTGGVGPNEYTARREQFNRAMTACLEARSYSVHVASPTAPTAAAQGYVAPPAPAPAPAPVYTAHYAPAPTFRYHPFSVSVSGGPSITTGDVSQNFDDGGETAVGFSFFPSEALPVGIRIEGNYSWFAARDQFLIANNANFGHQEVYGGDADLQFNLWPLNPRSRFYLFGGAGWYRERTTLHQVAPVSGTVCGFFFCGSGQFFAVSATARETTPWRDSWNAGLGWELALSDVTSVFVEARYRQIGPDGSREGFVPIQAGFRF